MQAEALSFAGRSRRRRRNGTFPAGICAWRFFSLGRHLLQPIFVFMHRVKNLLAQRFNDRVTAVVVVDPFDNERVCHCFIMAGHSLVCICQDLFLSEEAGVVQADCSRGRATRAFENLILHTPVLVAVTRSGRRRRIGDLEAMP